MVEQFPPSEARIDRYFIISKLQMRYALTYILVIAVVLVLMNIYPVLSFRNMVFSSKENSLINSANVISAAMGGLDALTEAGVKQVVEVVGGDGSLEIVVTNAAGHVLYGDAAENSQDLVTALGGKDVFRAHYSREFGFISTAAVPVVSQGQVIGCVTVQETDVSQAMFLREIQEDFTCITMLVIIFTMGMSLIFSFVMTTRINRLLEGVKKVRAGNYGEDIILPGSDELAQLSVEFNSMTERLKTDEEERRRFVSDASHELKTPIAAIRLLSDSIVQADNIDVETAKEFAEDISWQTDRLKSLSEKLLVLSRQDEGGESHREPLDLSEHVAYGIRLLRPLAQQNGVTFHHSLNSGCFVMSSSEEMGLVVFNLLENAVKYNVPGGRVTASVVRNAENVFFVVEDTGIGIPDEDKEKVFQRFYRVDKARSRKRGGSGIGLSIVSGAVEAMGGNITVEDGAFCGTRFTVVLPVCAAPPEQTDYTI